MFTKQYLELMRDTEFFISLFGLTNGAAIFQTLSLEVRLGFFFDDILVYCNGWDQHIEHLSQVLQVLQVNDCGK